MDKKFTLKYEEVGDQGRRRGGREERVAREEDSDLHAKAMPVPSGFTITGRRHISILLKETESLMEFI